MAKKRSLVDAAKDPIIEKRTPDMPEQAGAKAKDEPASGSWLSLATGFVLGLAAGICIVLL